MSPFLERKVNLNENNISPDFEIMKNLLEAVFNFDAIPKDNKLGSDHHKQSGNRSKREINDSVDEFPDEDKNKNEGKFNRSISNLSRELQNNNFYGDSKPDLNPSKYEVISLKTIQEHDLNISRSYEQRGDDDNGVFPVAKRREKRIINMGSGLSSSNPSSNKQSSSQHSLQPQSTNSRIIFISNDD